MQQYEDITNKRDEAWEANNDIQALLFQVTLYYSAPKEHKGKHFAELSWALCEILNDCNNGDDYATIMISIFSYKEIFFHSEHLSDEFLAIIVMMIAEDMKLNEQGDTLIIVNNLHNSIKRVFGSDSNELSAFLLYMITNIYQYTDPDYAIKLYENNYVVNKAFADELSLSDLYLFIGSIYNNLPEKRTEALLLLQKGLDIRERYTGEDSIFTQLQKIFIMENYYLSGDYTNAENLAKLLYDVGDTNGECKAIIRCYAALTLANIEMSIKCKESVIENYLRIASNNFSNIDNDTMFFDFLMFGINTSWVNYYAIIGDSKKEEYHSRKVFNYLTESGIKTHDTIHACNNLALCLLKSGITEKAKEILKEALALITELKAETSEAAGYVYNTIGCIDDIDFFGEKREYFLKRATDSINKNRPDVLMFRLNKLCSILDHENPNKNLCKQAEAEFLEVDNIITTNNLNKPNIVRMRNKVKILLYLSNNNSSEAKEFLSELLKKIIKTEDSFEILEFFFIMHNLIIKIASIEELESLILRLVSSYKDVINKALMQYDNVCQGVAQEFFSCR